MIAVTGATGQLGRLVIPHLIKRGVDPRRIVALARNPQKAVDLGVTVRQGDYSDPATLETVFEGVSRVLLISSSEVGHRVAQHRNVIEAATAAGVLFMAYTSAPYADSTPLQLAAEHRATEDILRESGLNYAFLRNGWYMENYTTRLPQALQQGAVLGSAGDGRISAATRSDLAEAAAVVISNDGHDRAVYELGGDDAFTMRAFADEITRQTGKKVVYQNLPLEAYTHALIEAGVPQGYAAALADSERAIADGHLYIDTGDLSRLIGHPPMTLRDALAEAALASAAEVR